MKQFDDEQMMYLWACKLDGIAKALHKDNPMLASELNRIYDFIISTLSKSDE